MNAQLELHPIPPIKERPAYDNAMLGYEIDWIEANIFALLDWWDACCHETGEWNPLEFPSFARSQHDLELTRREDFKNTLRMHDE